MQLALLLCLTLLSPLVASRHRQHSQELKKQDREPSADAIVAPSSRDFACDLYRALASANPRQNVFFSPLSVSMSLAMLALGARFTTAAQILEGLGVQRGAEDGLHEGFGRLLRALGQPTAGFQLRLGSALFADPGVGVHSAFLSALKTTYLADIFPTNFGDPGEAQKQINDYVAKQTQNKIMDLVQDLDSTHIMVMVNYIFFKASWETGFNRRNTREQDFHVTSETTVRVPMMSREDQYYYLLDRNLSCKVVGIPYQGNATAIFVLPSEGKMEQLENGLSEKTLKKWLRMFKKRQLEVYLPKFSIQGSYQLEKILPQLGIRDVFTSYADLSGITNHSDIQVSEMVHKAVVEVDESGTTAAAATGTIFMFRSARLSTSRIVFDHPFLMFIVENMNILFFGKVTHP